MWRRCRSSRLDPIGPGRTDIGHGHSINALALGENKYSHLTPPPQLVDRQGSKPFDYRAKGNLAGRIIAIVGVAAMPQLIAPLER